MAEREGNARRLADDLWLIDTVFQGEPGVIACYLLTGPDGLALVDVGSSASVAELLAGVERAGFDPHAIEHLVLTHIHLDHAGASGTLVRQMPRAHVYVHRLGAPHLVDPSRLLVSAERIYGDRMQILWGQMEPVPQDRLVTIDDGDLLRVGSRRLRVLYTPGHAVHHVAFHDETHNEVFAGDVAGVRLEGASFVRPPTPPPDLDLEQWYASIERLDALDPRVVYLPHFGAFGDVRGHLRQLRERLGAWGQLMLAGIRDGKSDAELAADLAAHYDPELAPDVPRVGDDTVQRYELATNYLMSAQGYRRYFQKRHPELLT
jgi:glyoxylase-like metal-dependent hydrolase (beta-lactamase superfamily II)